MLLGKITDGDQKMSYVYDKCVAQRAARGRAWHAAAARRRLAACILLDSPLRGSATHPRSCVFHYIVERGITYLCLADEKNKRRIPFLYLDDIKAKFQTAYGERANTAIAFAMNADFARVLQVRAAAQG